MGEKNIDKILKKSMIPTKITDEKNNQQNHK